MSKFLLLFIFFTTLNAGHVENDIKRDYIFAKWKKFHKLNKEILHSHGHNAFVDIYLNDIALSPYINKHTHFPKNSIIIKPLYADEEREHLARIVIMIKMAKGYDEAHSNWWYGVYDKTGTKVAYEGKIKSCIECHKIAKQTDYLFTTTVMEEINFQD
ncbi:cytochrome P460 family protein [Sulfurimonas sp.]